MSFNLESITSQATYESLKGFNEAIAPQHTGTIPDSLKDLSSRFDLSFPPSLGARVKASLAGLRFIAWLAPSWKDARAYCDLFHQRERNVQALLVNQRKLLMSEYGSEAGMRQALGVRKNADLPKFLQARDVRELRDTQTLVSDLRAVSRSVVLYESIARGTCQNRRMGNMNSEPIENAATLRSFTYGVMSQALEGLPGMTAQRRSDLLAGFRAEIEHLQSETLGAGLTPAVIDSACEEYLVKEGVRSLAPVVELPEPAVTVWHAGGGTQPQVRESPRSALDPDETTLVRWFPGPGRRDGLTGRPALDSASMSSSREIPSVPVSRPTLSQEEAFDRAALE